MASSSIGATPPVAATDDPYLWLERIDGERALGWVRQHNEVTQKELEADPEYAPLRQRLLSIFNSDERIPVVTMRAGYLYNFWRDAAHPRGVWRRTTMVEYRKPQPQWETVLDLDALASAERENWVWKGAEALYPGDERAMIKLSRGGGDAVVTREFDVKAKRFVDAGFALPEAKSDVAWRDRNHLYVGTDFGPGSLTDAGYPRTVRLWTRGTALADAPEVFAGETGDVAVSAVVVDEPGIHRELMRRQTTFYTGTTELKVGDRWVRLEVPDDAEPSTWHDQLLVQLRDDWTVAGKTYPGGALLASPLEAFLAGKRDFAVLFEPRPRVSLASVTETRHHLVVGTLDNVQSRLFVLTPGASGWSREPLDAPSLGSVDVQAVDPDRSDEFFLHVEGFLTPASVYLGSIGKPERTLLKQLPNFFDTRGLEVTQHEATSADGTRVPYFQVGRKDLKADGSHPTLLYGYGGFEISMTPFYSGSVGAAWLERGGVYVLANIRGGGEFGPAWHQAAVKEHRQHAYDDFIAVAENLIERKLTSPARLGIQGGSNGGLLMGVMLTQRPDLFGAVVCQVPLLDMRRYHRLLAGASWMGEYGDPDDPAQWAYISRYSPYHNLRAGQRYPRTLFMTSTRDDRVHPGHARKMAAKMQAMGADLLYFENIEGGHGGAANNEQQATMSALAFVFLQRQLMGSSDQPRQSPR